MPASRPHLPSLDSDMTLPVDSLIPITISSGFDVEGEERIHAAKEQSIIRAPWTAPPQGIAYIVNSYNAVAALGYGTFDRTTGVANYLAFSDLYPYWSSYARVAAGDGVLFTCGIGNTPTEAGQSLKAFTRSGNVLTEVASFIFPSSGMYPSDIVAVGNTVYCLLDHRSNSQHYLQAATFNGTGFTAVGTALSLGTGDQYRSAIQLLDDTHVLFTAGHKGTVAPLVLCTFDGTNFTQTTTITGTGEVCVRANPGSSYYGTQTFTADDIFSNAITTSTTDVATNTFSLLSSRVEPNINQLYGVIATKDFVVVRCQDTSDIMVARIYDKNGGNVGTTPLRTINLSPTGDAFQVPTIAVDAEHNLLFVPTGNQGPEAGANNDQVSYSGVYDLNTGNRITYPFTPVMDSDGDTSGLLDGGHFIYCPNL